MRLLWQNMGKTYPDWEDSQYLQNYRVAKDTRCGSYFKPMASILKARSLSLSLPPAKRLAIVLHWLTHASSFSQLDALYALGKSTVVCCA